MVKVTGTTDPFGLAFQSRIEKNGQKQLQIKKDMYYINTSAIWLCIPPTAETKSLPFTNGGLRDQYAVLLY